MNDVLKGIKVWLKKERNRLKKERSAPIDHSIHPDIREGNDLFMYSRLECVEDLLDEIKELENGN